MITLIAAVGRRREIGYLNKLPWSIPEDLKHFRSYTMGKVVVMGRHTFDSIGSRGLPGRKCMVISSQDLGNRAVRLPDAASVLELDHCYDEIVVIGGETVYRQLIDLADKLVITHIDAEFEADSFFPEINLNKWIPLSTVKSMDENYKYSFVEYKRQ